MGDMAQDALHRAMIEEHMLEEYLSGNMSEGGAYENGFINELGYSAVYDKVVDRVWAKQLQQEDVIGILIDAGYGWKKYAESVSSQNRITDKQAQTLYKMYEKLLALRNAASARENWKPKVRSRNSQSYRSRHDNGLDHDQIGDWGAPEW